MKQGTISVLLGCHSPGHSACVAIAWRRLYGKWPAPWQWACIFVHDLGHWGKDYLDDYAAKKSHWQLGARIAGKLFGLKGYELVAGHCGYNGGPRSLLYEPDKYSWLIAPYWLLWLNTIFEPKLQRPGHTRRQSVRDFVAAMRINWKNGLVKQGHDIYLEQWGRPWHD